MPNVLDGERLYYAFLAGAAQVSINREYLNKTNVFPVPDGDTGNNLLATINSVAQARTDSHLGISLNSMAEAVLLGARGNSGIIFSQFIQGLAMEASSSITLTTESFAKAVLNAVPYAYKAIANPVEGTMITVMNDWALALQKLAEKHINFVDMLTESLKDARKSLQDTPNKLKVLKDSRVLDSGASGFVNFLEGFTNYLSTGKYLPMAAFSEVAVSLDEPYLSESVELSHRYCTEALVSGSHLNLNEIRDYANSLGESVIVAGTDKLLKVHIHTNQPAELFSYLRKKGQIISQKAEDMQQQFIMAHSRKSEIALVTDSIADLPQHLKDEYQIYTVPVNLLIEGSAYLDKVTITPKMFYSLLDEVNDYPTSSQPNQKEIEELLGSLKNHYKSIIVITVAKALSGTWNAFKQAADKLSQGGYPISVIDSRLNSGAQGLVVLQAAREIAAGKSHQQVVSAVKEKIPKAHIYVSVNTFKYMVRGGRVSPLKGWLAKILNMKPIVSLDKEGRGIAFATAFTQKANLNKIVSLVQRLEAERGGVVEYSIVHCGAPERAAQFSQRITELLGRSPLYTEEISPVVGLSAGVGAVAVSLVTQ